MTRNEKFNTIIGEYFNTSILFENNEFPVVWTMKRSTRNANKLTQKYCITIPKKVVAFTVDASYSVDGVEYEPGPIYREQELPPHSQGCRELPPHSQGCRELPPHSRGCRELPPHSRGCRELPPHSRGCRDLQTDFNMYFEPYVLYVGADKKSSVEVLNRVDAEDNICLHVSVSYYRAHMPYPFGQTNRAYLMRVLDDQTKIEYLEREVAELKRKNQDLEEDTILLNVRMEDLQKENTEEIGKLRILLEEKDDYYTEIIYDYRQSQITTIAKQIARKNRLRNVVFELYKEKSVLEDCMVCLEKIQPDNLYVSECCHFICFTCAEQCDCCPSCRCSY